MKKHRKSRTLSSLPDTDGCDLSDAHFGEISGLRVCCTNAGAYDWEDNDCVVRALAATANISYGLAHKIFKKWGRKDKEGPRDLQIFLYVSPFKWRRYVRKPVRLTTFLKKHPKGRFLLSKRVKPGENHAFCVVDGEIVDYGYNSPCSIIQAAWRLNGLKAEVLR